MIVSASRRTDIPLRYSEWMEHRLRAGTVLVRNPMNRAQVSRLPLSPETTGCIVFWTKDCAPMLPRLDAIDRLGFHNYFQFTLTPYGRALERGLRSVEDRLETFLELGRRVGKDRLVWRYDPIVLNGVFSPEWHLRQFESLCARVSTVADSAVISFVDRYQKNGSAFSNGLLRVAAPEEMLDLAGRLAECAARYGVSLSACCEAVDLSACGVGRASCIDTARVERVCGYPIPAKPDGNQRPGCRAQHPAPRSKGGASDRLPPSRGRCAGARRSPGAEPLPTNMSM